MLDFFNSIFGNINQSTVYIEMLAIVITIISFINITKYLKYTSISLLTLFLATGLNPVVMALLVFNLVMWTTVTLLHNYISKYNDLGASNYKGISQNIENKKLTYSLTMKVIWVIWLIFFSVFLWYGIYLIIVGQMPVYFLILLGAPVLVVAHYSLSGAIELFKKIYYLNFVLSVDIEALEYDIETLGLSDIVDNKQNLQEKVKNIRAQSSPMFVINQMRHIIPEKQIINQLISIEEDSKKVEEFNGLISSLEVYREKMNKIFGLHYFGALYSFLAGQTMSEARFMKSITILYIAHTASLYRSKRDYFLEKENKRKQKQKENNIIYKQMKQAERDKEYYKDYDEDDNKF